MELFQEWRTKPASLDADWIPASGPVWIVRAPDGKETVFSTLEAAEQFVKGDSHES